MTMAERHGPTLLAALLGLWALLPAAPASAAPQTFNTALPVSQGQFVFRLQLRHNAASRDFGASKHDLRVLGAMPVAGYGVNSRLAVFAALPVLDKRLRVQPDSGEEFRRRSRGPGDARVFGRYTVWRGDQPGGTNRLALFGGFDLPVGTDDDSDRFGRLPQPLQPASGSVDALLGAVATWQRLEWQFDAQVAWEINNEANGFEFGDRFRFDTAWQYRLLPRKLGPGTPGFLYGALELNFRHDQASRSQGRMNPGTGGEVLFLSPGIQYVTREWMFEGIVQIPVYRDAGVNALEPDLGVQVGIRRNF